MLREQRSPSQILFNLLPEQTADMSGRIWKVSSWQDPIPLLVDDKAVRRRLIAALHPWSSVLPRLDNFAADQLQDRHSLEVVSLNKDRGVVVEPWPQVWVCQNCRRIERSTDHPCKCGTSRWSQLHYVGYHECGYVSEPWIPPCPTHRQVQMNSPGTAQAKDLRFTCPICHREMLKGLGAGRPCRGCGKPGISYTVHRAASVYSSFGFTMVNPARPDQLRDLQPAQCLDWILEGMPGDRPQDAPSSQNTLLESLIANGMTPEVAQAMVDAAAKAGHGFTDAEATKSTVTGGQLDDARDDALDLAVGVYNGRRSATGLASQPVSADLASRYDKQYPPALRRAGLEEVDLVDRFPVLRGVFGYSRDASSTSSRLVMFRGKQGAFRVYADTNETEALLIRLDPLHVARWLHDKGLLTAAPASAKEARTVILQQAVIPARGDEVDKETAGSAILTLLHSYTHRLIRSTAVYAGIDRDSLAEYLVPRHLSAFVYAGSRGDFVLGGLQAVFEGDLDDLLKAHVDNDARCPLDPGCSRGVGACPACLHLGEPSCTYYNRFLDRRVLFGRTGYLSTLDES